MNRRSFLRGLIAAPAVVAVGSLMPIRGIVMAVDPRWHHFHFIGHQGNIRLFVDGLEYPTALPIHPEVTRRYGWSKVPDVGMIEYWVKDNLLDELRIDA